MTESTPSLPEESRRQGRIRKRILVPLVGTVVVFLAAALFGVFRMQEKQLHDSLQEGLLSFNFYLTDLARQEAAALESQLVLIRQRADLLEAWQRGDRDQLLARSQPLFDELNRSFRLTHFYFIGTDQVCFLRVHQPDRYGDTIRRHTMNEARRTAGLAAGVELGPLGTMTLRVVTPWVEQGTIRGYVEVGKEIDHFMPLLHHLVGGELLVTIDKQFLNRELWQEGLSMLGRHAGWDEFPGFVVTTGDRPDYPEPLRSYLTTLYSQEKPGWLEYSAGGRTFRVSAVDLFDVGKRRIGRVVVFFDVSDHLATLHEVFLLLAGIAGVASGSVLLFFFFHTGRIESQLADTIGSLAHEVTERTLAEERLTDYQGRLEEMVAARTGELETANLSLEREIADRRRMQDLLKLDEERLEAQLRLTGRQFGSETELIEFALEEAVRLTRSRVGYFHFYNDEESSLGLHTWTQAVLEECTATKVTHYPLAEAGIWADCIRLRRPVLHNDYSSVPGRRGLPEGHFPLFRHMSLPVMSGGRIEAVVGVGNKEEPYNQDDIRQLTLYFGNMLTLLQESRAETALRDSEAKYRGLFDGALDAILVAEADTGFIVDCNKAAADLVGRRREELIGMHQRELHPLASGEEEFSETFLEHRRLADGSVLETRLLTAAGLVRDVTVKANVFEYKGRRLVQGIFRDVTEQKRAQAALAKSEKKFRQLFDSASDAIFIHGEGGNFIEVNSAACLRLGYSREELLRLGPADIDEPEFAALVPERLAEIMEKGSAVFETAHRTRDGRVIPSEVSSRLIEFEGRQAVLSMVRDITERKEHEAQLLRAREEAEAANAAKSMFLANMSHEIRTPMNAILGLGYLALQTELTSGQRDYLNKIHSSARSLLGIIDAILDFSKIEAGRLELESTPFAVDQLLAHVANLTTVQAERKNLELVFAPTPELPARLVGDPLRLGQVLTNLVNNAVKFTERGEIVVSIAVQEERAGETVLRFSVRDTGIGMEPAQVEKLFQPFTQADSSTTRKYGGSGLGLSIVQALVNLMGGELEVESEPGRGSTFSFTAVFGRAAGRRPGETGSLPAIRGRRALVVDDNETAREILASMLKSFGMLATGVDSGAAGLAELERSMSRRETERYDLVLLDWRMPEQDGIDTARAIRANPRLTPAPALIMITAFGIENLADELHELRIGALLAKPVNQSSLYNAIMEAMDDERRPQRIKPAEFNDLQAGLARLRGARILVVEDHPLNQQVAREILEKAGFEVDMAANGREALDMLEAGLSCEGVLMDLQMPLMDGFEATQAIRGLGGRFSDLPILAMTAHALPEERQKCLAAGMNDHLAKPIEVGKLKAALVRWIKPGAGAGRQGRTFPEAGHRFSVPLPDHLPGIDIDTGLRRLGNNRELFRRLLAGMRAELPAVLENIQASLSTGDLEKAARLLHTLKGTAGNVAATELHRTTTALEREVREDLTADGGPALQGLRQAVEQFVAVTGSLEPEAQGRANDRAAASGEAAGTVDPEVVAPLLRKMAAALAINSMRARELVVPLGQLLASSLLVPELARLQEALDGLRFRDALAVVEEMARRSNISLKEETDA